MRWIKYSDIQYIADTSMDLFKTFKIYNKYCSHPLELK